MVVGAEPLLDGGTQAHHLVEDLPEEEASLAVAQPRIARALLKVQLNKAMQCVFATPH